MIEVGGLFGLILLAAVVYAIVKTLGSTASTGSKVVWTLVLLLIPVLGLILWFFLGPKAERSLA